MVLDVQKHFTNDIHFSFLSQSGRSSHRRSISGVPRYTVKTGSSAAKLGRSSRAKADSTCSYSVLSALMLLLNPVVWQLRSQFSLYTSEHRWFKK